MNPEQTRATPKVCLVGTSPPRRCGIATFTDDLRQALVAAPTPSPTVQLALTDPGGAYRYGPDVVFEIQEEQLSGYQAAAEFINGSDVDVVCLQHEFGIFGGPAGRHIETFLDHLDAAVVATLHTVLTNPPDDVRNATRRLAERCDRIVVLAEQAVHLLDVGYGIDKASVTVIPHGVPDLPAIDRADAKEHVGATDRTVLLTFGLLGPDKGVEVALEALPDVVRAHPDVLYLVVGATHPHVQRDAGESYRASLEARVHQLGLDDHVAFVDRYVDLEELRLHLAATDVYVTPYHSTDQIVSGTLAYAIGMGCAVVSTPYPYAVELLGQGRGSLVPYRDPRALSSAICHLLDDEHARTAVQARALQHGRQMRWPQVAAAYQHVFREVVADHERRPAPWVPVSAPPPSFSFLRMLTDDVGVLQHARHGVPDRSHGYCTDDVGRALAATVQGAQLGDEVAAGLVPTYLSFLGAAQQPDGSFENLLTYDRRWVPESASEDTLGQALWGLGETVARSRDQGQRALAAELIARSLPAAAELRATKAVAYALVGLGGHHERFPGALATANLMEQLGTHLATRLAEHSRPGWCWFDDHITYANAKVPEALMTTGRALDHQRWVADGVEALDFLLATTCPTDRFDFVGNEGWLDRSGQGAAFGQQPIEAGCSAQACMIAYEITGESRYLRHAELAVEWLLGRNRLGLALYDPATGRCADGLDRHGVSHNAGAESVVVALLGLLALPARPSASAGHVATPASASSAR